MIFGNFSHLSSAAVAIAFIAIPQTCYTRRKTSKTSCIIYIYAFIKTSRHFKKEDGVFVYIFVCYPEILRGLEFLLAAVLLLPQKSPSTQVVRCLAAAQLRDLVRMPNWMGCKFFWGDQILYILDLEIQDAIVTRLTHMQLHSQKICWKQRSAVGDLRRHRAVVFGPPPKVLPAVQQALTSKPPEAVEICDE